MGVYIKGMEIPSNCDDCLLDFDCPHDQSMDGYKMQGGRPRTCPLISIPPHGDLIDRDALEQDAQKRLLMCNKNDNHFQKPYEVMRAIALAPTIIPAEEGE